MTTMTMIKFNDLFSPEQISNFIRAHGAARVSSTLAQINDYIVAVEDGDLVGTQGVRRLNTGFYHLRHLAVHSSYRRRGIARAMLNFCFEQRKGVFVTQVRKTNLPSLNLLYSLGFKDKMEEGDFVFLMFSNGE